MPAKVNLHLRVGPRRDDGYHELVTVFHAVSLYDEVTATPARDAAYAASAARARASCRLDGGNLAWRAAVLLAERAGVEPARPAATWSRASRWPAGWPAAAPTRPRRWSPATRCGAPGWSRADLLELAAELGSDVPFALTGGTALGTGRGERLTPVLAAGRWHWVLAVAGDGLSTPEVYGELDRLRGERRAARRPATPDRLINALRTHDPAALGRAAGQRPAGGRARAAARSCAARCGSAGDLGRARRGRVRVRADLRLPGPVPGGARCGSRRRWPAPACAARVRAAYGPVPAPGSSPTRKCT